MAHSERSLHAWSGVLCIAALVAFTTPAMAQYYVIEPGPRFGLMPPEAGEAVVRSLGLTPIGPARAHGPVILVDAVGQEGSQVRVTVDRRSGRVRQIVRFAAPAPRIATVPPPQSGYGPDEDEYDERSAAPLPPYGAPALQPPPPAGYGGPQVIARERIQSEDLPPPGSGPRVVLREPEVTNSVPRTAAPGPVDPLLGVPKEFRNRPASAEPPPNETPNERVATRTPADAAPRATPLPRPRPADAPAVAARDSAPAKAESARPEPKNPAAGESKTEAAPPKQFPVQPLE